MAERVLRGSRLGTTSYETDRSGDLAPRRDVRYDCAAEHVTTVTLAADAEAPGVWPCSSCALLAKLHDGEAAPVKPVKPVRTHWDMVLERRSLDDLEEVLNERLAQLGSKPRSKSA